MAQPKNTLLRTVVPVLLILGGIGVAVAVLTNSRNRPAPPAAPPAVSAAAPSPPVAAPRVTPAPTEQARNGAGGTGAGGDQPSSPSGPAPGAAGEPKEHAEGAKVEPARLRARSVAGDPAALNFATIGSLDPASGYEALVSFSPYGAGVRSVALTRHFDTITRAAHTVVQAEHLIPPLSPGAPPRILTPASLYAVEIDGVQVFVPGAYEDPRTHAVMGTPVWRQTAPGAFEALIETETGEPFARLTRAYTLPKGSYELRIAQGFENLSGRAVTVRWLQLGPVDLEQDAASYGGDKRRVRFGYLLSPAGQGSDPTVLAQDFRWPRGSGEVLGRADRAGNYPAALDLWPNARSTRQQYRLVWPGLTNRYFGAAETTLFDPMTAGPDAKVMPVEKVDRVLANNWVGSGPRPANHPVIAVRTVSTPAAVPPGGRADFSRGFFAGPLKAAEITRDPLSAAANLRELIWMSFGGPCAFCTFGWITGLLLGLLQVLHHYVVFDWALAIIVMVVIVRTILHPVTKWSQVRMQRFGRQMQGMAPKQKKIQERYAGDPQKLREEMARLWREEGVSPAGFLGCLPGFLQSPVWIGLSATLYFAFDLRHQGAFFAIFQRLIPGHPRFGGWFLGDLAEPDRLVYFGHSIVSLPILGHIDSINILPVLLGVVFFIQQKYLTPPPTAPLTPEQEQQQKIMKVMMVVMFPVMMYNAPSGLALYFTVNSSLAILESRYIRSHIAKHDLLNVPKKPGGGKGGAKAGGFMANLQALAEAKQKQMQQRQQKRRPR
jgi:YidC/Oxa1 family membrane protein insertase